MPRKSRPKTGRASRLASYSEPAKHENTGQASRVAEQLRLLTETANEVADEMRQLVESSQAALKQQSTLLDELHLKLIEFQKLKVRFAQLKKSLDDLSVTPP